MYKNWNKNLINEQIKYLEDQNSEDLKWDINQLKILKNKKKDLVFPKCSFKETMTSDIYAIKRNISFIESIFSFTKNYLNYDKNYIKKHLYKNLDLNIPLLLEITYDFYTTIDKDFKKYFLKSFKERKNNLMFSKNYGVTNYINALDYNYINIYFNKSIDGIFEIIHEYGHVICGGLNNNLTYYSNPFVELIPITMELIMTIEGKKYIDKSNANQLMLYLITMIKGMLNESLYFSLWANYIPNSKNVYDKKICFVELKEKYNLKNESVKLLFETSNKERLYYIIPFLVAVEIAYIYVEDKEKALNILKNIIKSNNTNYIKTLEDNNIILNEHTSNLVKTLNNKKNPFKN